MCFVFLVAGRALKTINEKRLYRGRYDGFDAYCMEKGEISKAHAYRLIRSAEVYDRLSPIGDKYERPVNEAQVRPLLDLPESQQIEAWVKVVETAPLGKVTAAHVRTVVDQLIGKDRSENSKDGRTPAPAPRPRVVQSSKNGPQFGSEREILSNWERLPPGAQVDIILALFKDLDRLNQAMLLDEFQKMVGEEKAAA